VALNFTVDSSRRDLLFIKPDNTDTASSSKAGTSKDKSAGLPNPMFLVANLRTGRFAFAHSAVGLDHDNLFLFSSIEGFWFPRTRSGVAKGGTYLEPTGTDGTYHVKWVVDQGEAGRMKALRPVTLATRVSV
jgi:hypothetical protein